MSEQFIEQCAHEYFNGYAKSGVPFHQSLTFEQFINLKLDKRHVSSCR